MGSSAEAVRGIIHDNLYITLATASRSGEPWVSPVYFNFNDDYSIVWRSNVEAKHSLLIRQNGGRVAAVVFDSRAPAMTGDAVYLAGRAVELSTDADIRAAIACYHGGRHERNESDRTEIEDYRHPSPLRLYRLDPEKVFRLGSGESVLGYYVDNKIEISLESLRA